jgi:plastocyanin
MKNNRAIIWAVIVLVLLIVLVIILSARKGNENVGPGEENNNQTNEQTGDQNLETIIDDNGNVATVTPSLYEGRSVDLVPQTITASGTTFSPKIISAPAGSRINWIFQADDGTTHKIVFTDKVMEPLNLTFSKVGGNKSVTFPSPAVGTYNFYIDDINNKGKLIVK